MMCKMMSNMVAEAKVQLNAAELQIHKSATESLDAPADNNCPDCSEGSINRTRLEGAAEAARSQLLCLKDKLSDEDALSDADEAAIDRVIASLDQQLYDESDEDKEEED